MNLSKVLITGFSTIVRRATAPHDQTSGGEDGRRRRRQQGVSSEGALQVHVYAQHPGQQLLLVLIEALERIEDGGAAPVHPGGKQAGGAELGCQGLVVVELQLARKPAMRIRRVSVHRHSRDTTRAIEEPTTCFSGIFVSYKLKKFPANRNIAAPKRPQL